MNKKTQEETVFMTKYGIKEMEFIAQTITCTKRGLRTKTAKPLRSTRHVQR